MASERISRKQAYAAARILALPELLVREHGFRHSWLEGKSFLAGERARLEIFEDEPRTVHVAGTIGKYLICSEKKDKRDHLVDPTGIHVTNIKSYRRVRE